ncbi:hypothetical protein B0T26DRAFT_636015 [Lasiosphaeria miniovina]|uniref:F-box domain-containing protein n=1 Tax=Lasiosphaeria miniovina TaxID=1954250 RepID=A0AA40E5J8_9PEZI|nr:uncharacterized protein B0T26DRAFT_636015 [Lasiosphaeria miniovina]KAK0727940.1 hypothetical protein B0T26DRAFT_636015 [Lasiosphaeria miniovina]
MPTAASACSLASLPPLVLERIFAFVCPHSRDESYDTCEESAIEDACMLCGLRDLAHCVAVSKKWRKEAIKLLYHSIRIDTVHYCEREAQLAERRKRRSHFDRNGEPEDTALARLKLLSRTLREDPVRLGRLVQFLKMPYMLRESCQPDLARTIAVTPDLRYVDLPEGLFADEPSYVTLRLEVQARSLELRKMTYTAGSERSLQDLASGTVWARLEVLELVRINIDPGVLRQVLGCLGSLRALKISDTMSVGDETLAWNPMLPPFPPLEEFILTEVPNVTVDGLKSWLELPEARQALRVLTLNTTGVPVWTLQEILAHLPGLKHLSVIDSVAAAMPGAAYVPLLSSPSLETLHFEITAAVSSPKFTGITPSYYNYLASSLVSGGLANLHALYVRDPNFPDMLLGLPPPTPAFADGGIARPISSSAPRSPGFGPKSASHSFISPVGSPSFAPSPQHLSPFGNPPGSFGHRQQDSLSSIYSTQSTPQQPAWQQLGYNPQRLSSNNPFAAAALGVPTGPAGIANLPSKLEVFTKGEDELSWSFAQVNHFSSGRSGGGSASGRPLSSYGLGADVMGGSASGWSSGGGARRSVLVGGAGGGFLAVPSEGLGGAARGRNSRASNSGGEDEWPRPKSSAGETKRERRDLWR